MTAFRCYLTATDGIRRMFHKSTIPVTEQLMWQVLNGMQEDGFAPLLIEHPCSHWREKIMREKSYFLVPLTEIALIECEEINDNQRIFLTDAIRGSTSEQ